jgi:hypothetical protein
VEQTTIVKRIFIIEFTTIVAYEVDTILMGSIFRSREGLGVCANKESLPSQSTDWSPLTAGIGQVCFEEVKWNSTIP